MLSTEVYFRHGHWWFAVVELGHLRQVIDRLVQRRCRNKKEAGKQADAALTHFKRKGSDAA